MDERKHAAHICLTLPAIYVTMAVEWMERGEKNKMTKYEVLKKYFGYDSFREGQEMLVDALLSGQDVLGIMPTGAGKSIVIDAMGAVLGGRTSRDLVRTGASAARNYPGGIAVDFSDEGSGIDPEPGGDSRCVSEQLLKCGAVPEGTRLCHGGPVQDNLCCSGTPSNTGIFVRGAVDGNFDD